MMTVSSTSDASAAAFLAAYQVRMLSALSEAEFCPPVPVERILKTPPKLDYAKCIRDWWNSMAPAVRNHPWMIETIMATAFKDQPRRPAMRCVANVLRSTGWTERRDWTRAGRNRRQWIPPTTT